MVISQITMVANLTALLSMALNAKEVLTHLLIFALILFLLQLSTYPYLKQ